jgi:hypothetical protein
VNVGVTDYGEVVAEDNRSVHFAELIAAGSGEVDVQAEPSVYHRLDILRIPDEDEAADVGGEDAGHGFPQFRSRSHHL